MKKIKIACEVKDYLPLKKLEPLQGELKSLSEADYGKLKKEILETGFAFPIHVWKGPKGKTFIVGGHQRARTLLQLEKEGYAVPPLPVVYIEAKGLKEAKRRVLQDVAQYGQVERQGLYEFMGEAGLGMGELADSFRIPDISLNLESFNTEFFVDPAVPPPPVEDSGAGALPGVAKVSPGELWRLGPHRVLCGDCTDIQALEKLLQGERVELAFTSPPYADQREYEGGKDLSTQHLATFIRTAAPFTNYFAVNLGYARKDGEVLTYWDDYIAEARANELKLLSWNIWDRSGFCYTVGQATAMFTVDHEWILVFGRRPKDLHRTVENKHAGNRQHGTNRQKDGSLTPVSDQVTHSHRQLGTVVRVDVDRDRSVDHPAKFPLSLPKAYIEAMTDIGQLVYEPFGGSGTTLIAANNAGRRACVMELEPKYVQVILERWVRSGGEEPIRDDGVKWSSVQ